MTREPEWLSRKEASRFLSEIGCPVAVQTLANMAVKNNERHGPPFYRFGNKVRYKADDLQSWVDAKAERVM